MRSHANALACVIGEIELVRSLALARVPCAAVSRPGDPVRYSRFTEATIDWVDPHTRPGDLVDRLLRFARTQPRPPVLFYDGDWDLLLVSRFRDELSEAFRFVVPEAALVEDLVDKARFQALARRLGLPVPAARCLAPGRGAGLDAIDVEFPVVVKPLTRDHDSWRSLTDSKAVTAANRSELEELWPLVAQLGIEVLVQECIPGPECAIESYHVYVDDDARVRAEFTGRKIRTFPSTNGYSTALETTDRSDVAELGRGICHALSLTGVAKLDFKRAPDGRLYLLEVNPRFNLWHHLGAKAGVNIPHLVYQDLCGEAPRAGGNRPPGRPLVQLGPGRARRARMWAALR